MFLSHLVRWPSVGNQVKFYGAGVPLEQCPRGTPPSEELSTRGVAEYSDVGPIERYISETAQDSNAHRCVCLSVVL